MTIINSSAEPPPLRDQEARKTALTGREHGLVVEAGAGSGKTAILAGRVALLIADGVGPANIAAITFTELAAAELAERVQKYVDQLAAGTVPITLAAAFPEGAPSDRQRTNLAAASEQLDELTCSTIHSFARELVRPYPVEADIDPGATVLDGAEQELLFKEVFETWLRQALGESRPGADHPAPDVASSEPTAASVVAQFMTATASSQREGLEAIARRLHDRPGSSAAEPESMAHLAARAGAAATEFRHLTNATTGATEVVGELLTQLPEFVQWLQQLKDTPSSAISVLTDPRTEPLFTKTGTIRKLRAKGRWVKAATEAGSAKSAAEGTYEAALQLHTELCAAFEELCHAAADTLLLGLLTELQEVGRLYRQHKRAAAALDFDDLIHTALELLRHHPTVRSELAAKYDHVLIDEFQDTDPQQAEIVWRLTGEPNGGDWRAWPSRPGARFVVGDPKQSIYRFRGADAATYAHLTNSLKADERSKTLELNTNFRSLPGILTAVNDTFAAPLATENQPGYRPLHARPGATKSNSGGSSVARLTVPGPNGDDETASVGQLREAEAHAVASLVRSLVQGTSSLLEKAVSPGDIALLAPAGSELEIYERALDRLQLNVASQAGKGFYRRQEVQDLVALTRVLADPRDRLALGALLRGPLTGATDQELLDATEALHEQEGDARYLSVTTDPHLLPNGHIRRTIELLGPIARERVATTPHALLTRALDALEVRAVIAHRHGAHADRALANVDRYIEHSRAYDVRGITAFAAHTWAAWADTQSELEGRTDSAKESVTLITIHSAKGLQWPVVIPINTISEPQAVSGVLYDRTNGHIAAKLYGQACSSYESVKQKEEAELAAERTRLWYVAATRAQELLVLPQHTAAVPERAWSNMLPWALPNAPTVEAATEEAISAATTHPKRAAQTREQPLAEAHAIQNALERIERRAPSRKDDDQADATTDPAAKESQPPVLTERQAAHLLSTLDDDHEPEYAEEHINAGTARGNLLHKLMEELINQETTAQADQLEARAEQLAAQLHLDHDTFDAAEVGQLALRAWNIPAIAELHGRLHAEVEVAGVETSAEPQATTIYWSGVADAIAVNQAGEPQIVIDWKSDRNPSPATLEHYREQLRAYLKLTGAPLGWLVLATTGTVHEISESERVL